ncbi:sensor histidine kinase [Algibacillus agarilyticus]|uniref:sensor histidine kinase n=1 Tax=Algibacillus agarilyticus TaxID=2234133 RepID=UPI000DCFCE3E|nr:histidine kinase [Algibacillus agarilyticus]
MDNRTANVSEIINNTLGKPSILLYRYCQVGFWGFICIVSYLSLTLWYGQYGLAYFLHIIVQSFMGLGISLLLQKAFTYSWYYPNSYRLALGFLLILIASLVWTVARMEAFSYMTAEQDIWWNFGGWYFAGFFIFLFWSAMFHGVIYYQLLQAEHKILLNTQAASREEQIKRIKAQAIARDAQLKMLRYQLNPHFLSNTLNAVNSLIEAQQNDMAQNMVVNLSKFMRYSLDNDPDGKVTLSQEIEALILYLDIEKVRFGDRLNFLLNVEDLANTALIPSLLLQPIIENSMKHVIAKSEEGGTITIGAYIDNGTLFIKLSDSGQNFKKQQIHIQGNENRSVGLRNIQERLETLYPNEHTFECEVHAQGGLLTTIAIPFEMNT